MNFLPAGAAAGGDTLDGPRGVLRWSVTREVAVFWVTVTKYSFTGPLERFQLGLPNSQLQNPGLN